MGYVWALVFVSGTAAFIVGLVMLPFARHRRRGSGLLVSGLLAVFVGGAGVSAAKDAEAANKLGFASVEDYRAAKEHAISDPAVWKVKAAEIEAAKPPPPKPMLEDVVGRLNVVRRDDRIIVNFDTGDLFNGESLFIKTGDLVNRIGKWAVADLSERLPTRRLVVHVYSPTVDAYGNSGRGLALTIEIDPAEYGKVNWKTLNQDGVLNLYDLKELKHTKAAAEYCSKQYRRTFAWRLCGQIDRIVR